MVWAKRTLWLLLTLFAGVLILQGVASESGEVVVLSTQGSGDEPEETRLWVVDLDGFQYLRAGQPESAGLKRLQAAPRVGVERGADRMAYDAVPEPERRDEINALARDALPFEKMVLLVVGDKAVIGESLTALGYPIVELDSAGAPVN